MAALASDSNTQYVEAGGEEAQGHPPIHIQFEDSQGYMRPGFGKKQKNHLPSIRDAPHSIINKVNVGHD